MSSIVTALYESRQEAERALISLKSKTSLAYADVYDPTQAGVDALQRIDLTTEERSVCQRKLADGEFLLLARARDGDDPDRIVDILESLADEEAPVTDAPMRTGPQTASQAAPQTEPRTEPQTVPQPAQVVAEERLPVIEEELRVGVREVVRGGAKVRSRVEEVPVTEEVELMEEFTRVERRPSSRPISQQELEQAGLLKERFIEIAQVREEAIINKEAFVREEVVVTKRTERRVEQIHETLRHTEVETESLGVDSPGAR